MSHEKDCHTARLSVCSLGIAAGITWALGVILIGLMSTYFGLATNWVDLLKSIYVGFDSTLLGTLIGGLWALIDGFICGALVALIYNHCSKCCGCFLCKRSKTNQL